MIPQPELSKGYGESVFKGAIADKYLKAVGMSAAAVGDLPNQVVLEMRNAADAFASLRVWALHALAEGVLG